MISYLHDKHTAMKTSLNQQQPLCKSQLNFGYLPGQLWQAWCSSFRAKMNRFSQCARATSQALRASLAAVSSELATNYRLLAALFLMLAIAPLSGTLYRFFDNTVVVNGWYFVNYFNLFVGLRGNLLAFFTILGIFFLFPARYKASYILAAPLGFIIADSIKRVLATSNAEYNAIVSFPYAILMVGLVLGFLLSIDYFLYKHHHIRRKYWAHIVGIIRTPGIPAEQKMKLLEGEIKSIETTYYSVY